MSKRMLAARLCAVFLALALVAAACGDDSSSTGETTTTTTAAPTTTVPSETESMGTVVDVAVASGSFPTLVAAVQAAGLVETLSGDGPFTVLAPTEDAFADLLDMLGMSAEELLADIDLLTAVLTYHVLPLSAPAEVVVSLDGQSVATVNGAEVAITVDGSTVMVNDAIVVQTDIEASNGIIHVIDTVLLPPSDPAEVEPPTTTTEAPAMEDDAMGTVVDVAVASGSFPTLVAAVQAAGLVETLSGDGPFTVL
ncbi:MAG: fasciclin domain-containing protein, partial [Acidimicrobiaceae bacterium]|nr:fasciclin domain-containing protein [Acidimicrobiaceae bacterium]